MSSRRLHSLLVLALPGEVEELRQELGMEQFAIAIALSTASAAAALRSSRIDAVVVSPGTPIEWIDELLDGIARIRPGVPVLAVRERNAVERVGWLASRVGVLRQPLLPNALARSVSAVLALRQT